MNTSHWQRNISVTKRLISSIFALIQKMDNFVSEHFVLKNLTGEFPAAMIEHPPLEAVYIYFDTATYDEIERDVKVTT